MEERGNVMKFISEKQIEELRKTRGDRVEDGTVTVERPLYEILQEAKDKKQAEFEDKYLKHRPPKALDDDETEFLEALEQQKREKEKAQAEEVARELNNFQTALASRTVYAYEEVRKPVKQAQQEGGAATVKRPAMQAKPKLLPNIRVMPVAKKPKVDVADSKGSLHQRRDAEKEWETARAEGKREAEAPPSSLAGLLDLGSYGSDDDEEENEDDGEKELVKR